MTSANGVSEGEDLDGRRKGGRIVRDRDRLRVEVAACEVGRVGQRRPRCRIHDRGERRTAGDQVTATRSAGRTAAARRSAPAWVAAEGRRGGGRRGRRGSRGRGRRRGGGRWTSGVGRRGRSGVADVLGARRRRRARPTGRTRATCEAPAQVGQESVSPRRLDEGGALERGEERGLLGHDVVRAGHPGRRDAADPHDVAVRAVRAGVLVAAGRATDARDAEHGGRARSPPAARSPARRGRERIDRSTCRAIGLRGAASNSRTGLPTAAKIVSVSRRTL